MSPCFLQPRTKVCNMLRNTARTWVFVAVWCCLLLVALGDVTRPSEVSALLAVKKKLIDPMGHLENWKKGDPCKSNWTGVSCFYANDTDGGYLHVRELQLLNMNLSGSLAPELGLLSGLQILDFMWNQLTGNIPKEIGKLSSLKLLLLNGNKLSGSLPAELGSLSRLNRLQVDENELSGPIPKSFANMSSVRHLHMNNNSFSGQIPSELSQLPSLLHVLLDNNNLSGYIPPELSKLPALRILQLDNNNFNGTQIPVTYSSFSNLLKLSLRNCGLQGVIPDFSNLTRLLYLDLSWNSLSGPLPAKLSDNMRAIDLSNNNLNGTIPGSYSNLKSLQTLSVENNSLTGSIPITIWQNISWGSTTRLELDLRKNLLSSIQGELNPPSNVTLRLQGNPICENANIANIGKFCGSMGMESWTSTERSTNSAVSCPVQACPTDDFFEYVPESPLPCFCASPLRIGYRLKSPSFSYFPPLLVEFETYITSTLGLELYELFIDAYAWEHGPRLRMDLKLFPAWDNATHTNTFNLSEVQRIRGRFTSWRFPGSDLFGPYELLNFTLLGPYAQMNLEDQGRNMSKGVVAAIVLGAIACVVGLFAIAALLVARRNARFRHKLSRRRLSSKASMSIEGVREFSFKEMTVATDNFSSSSEVGRGGYGKVYRGTLADQTMVAIKRAEEGSLQGQKEFLTEIKLLSRLHHRNLVSLIGYCDEEGEQMLVYEFMPNGTLRDWLCGKSKEKILNFGRRVSIALGSAKGIMYLHREANPPVFHRDIKATNILLDSKLTAKVADFGLSRLAPAMGEDEEAAGNPANFVSTVVRGTPGYLDPEYMLTHQLTDKSDVYSLGIVLLELLTGMQPISHGKNIVREVKMAYSGGMMFSIIDSRMGSYPSECVEKLVGLALRCCQEKPDKRPPVSEVVRELEVIVKMMPLDDQAAALLAMYYDADEERLSSSKAEEGSSAFGKGSSSSTSTSTAGFAPSSFYTSSNSDGRSRSLKSVVSGSDLMSGVAPTISPR
ncbi:Probable LRR receptor-like serine/threonine-protein kinase At1g06840 [Linum grandiflorum]